MPEPVVNIVTPEVTVVVASGGLTSGGPTNDPPPTATTVDISGNPDLGDTVATLRGIVQDYGFDCDAWFEWAGPFTTQQTSPALPNSTPTQALPGLPTNLDYAYTISNLTANKYYYFRARAQNLNGATAGIIMEFRTFPAGGSIDNPTGTDPIPVQLVPTCTTGAAVVVSPTSETISGFADSGAISKLTQLHLYYRLAGTSSWVSVTPTPSTTTNNITAGGQTFVATIVVSPHTSYEYYASATNADGTTDGAVLSFTSASTSGVEPIPGYFGTLGNPQVTPSSITLRGTLTDTNSNPGDYSTTAMRYRVTGTGSWQYILWDGTGANTTDLILSSLSDPQQFAVTASTLQPNTLYDYALGATNQYVVPGAGKEQNHIWTSTASVRTDVDTAAVPNASTLTITQQPGAGPALGFTITGTFNAGGNGGETTNCYAKWKYNSDPTIYTSAIIDTTTSPTDQPETFSSSLATNPFADGDSIRAWFYAIQGIDGSGADDKEGARLPLTFNAYPGGVAPTTTSLAASAITDTTATVTFTCSDTSLNTSNITGTVTVQWKKQNLANYPSGQIQTSTYTTATLPFTNRAFTFQLSGLVASTAYTVKAIITNPRGTAQIETVGLLTTSAGSGATMELHTAAPVWFSADMATLRGTYKINSPAATATLRWRYRTPAGSGTWNYVLAAGATFTQAVAVVGSNVAVDACISGLLPLTQYEFGLEGTPNTGSVQVSADTGPQATFTTTAAPTGVDTGSSLPVFTGTGPGSRATPMCPAGNDTAILPVNPDEDWTHTYATVQRPSSGYIRLDNARTFYSNLYYTVKTNGGGTNLYTAQQALYSGGTYAAHLGYDIIVFGKNNGVGKTNYSFEIWDPLLVETIQAGAAVPLTFTTTHGAGQNNVLVNVITQLSRWGHVIGCMGEGLLEPNWGGGGQSNAQVTWREQTAQGVRYHNLAHVSFSGLTAVTVGTVGAWRQGMMTWRSVLGSFHDIGFRRRWNCNNRINELNGNGTTVGNFGWLNTQCTFMKGGGSMQEVYSDPSHRTIERSSIGGLVLLYDSEQRWAPEGGWVLQQGTLVHITEGIKWCVRGTGAQLRMDVRHYHAAFSGERPFYISNFGSKMCHTERTSDGRIIAAPVIFDDVDEYEDAVCTAEGHHSTNKQSFQLEARWADDSTGNAHSGATAGNDLGYPGEGVIYLRSCRLLSEDGVSNGATDQSNGVITLIGTHGWFIIESTTGNNCINIYADRGKQHGVNPVTSDGTGNNGLVVANKGLWVKSFTLTKRVGSTSNVPSQKSGICLDSTIHARIDSITMAKDVAAVWPAEVSHIRIGAHNGYYYPQSGTQNPDIWLIPTHQNSVDANQVVNPAGQRVGRPVGFVQLGMPGAGGTPTQPSTWPGWNAALEKVHYGAAVSQSTPNEIAPGYSAVGMPPGNPYTWTSADIDAAWITATGLGGIGIEYQSGTSTLEPRNQPSSYTYPHRLTLPVAGEDY